jgi:hypothetical protein
MLPTLEDYERLAYGLPNAFPVIRHSTLVVVRRGPAFAEVTGEIAFDYGIALGVWEDLNFVRGVIQGYSYWVTRGEERLYWYDPQPHPQDQSLAGTFPHHKHIPPDMKRNRVPAPGISFTQPNLPFLVEEIERELLAPAG